MSGKTLLARLAVVGVLMAADASAMAAQTPSQTASEFYMTYRAAFAEAKVIEEILPYMSKAVRAQIEAMPAAERPKRFEIVKEMSKMTNLKVIKETKTDEGVTLTVEGIADKEKMTGEIQIVKEDGAWKMGRERWSSKS